MTVKRSNHFAGIMDVKNEEGWPL